MKDKFYITTPIYYPSNKLTLGNAYTTVFCDGIARFMRLLGKDVFFLTGTDEHGQKIAKIASANNVSEIEFLDKIVADSKQLWELLDVKYDRFIRTTEKEHELVVQKTFKKLYDKGYIYKSTYTGLYCTPCESFWSEAQLVNNCCPDCGREVSQNVEESYFFKLSAFADKLLDLYKNQPEFLVPEFRVNEMVNNFIANGLEDLCVSRTSVKWGIEVPFDKNHTVYVWLDALLNYLSALGYETENDQLFKKYWPADVHVVGKEIVRFHAIIWPAFLMALDLPLPKKIYGHGWILFGKDKLSKSKDVNSKEIIDPRILASKYGSDSVRYLLLKQLSFGQDAPYSTRDFLTKYNSDLVNNYGNLISRSFTMLFKYFDGVIPTTYSYTELENKLIENINNLQQQVIDDVENLDTSKALTNIFLIFDAINKYLEVSMPWTVKDDTLRLASIMHCLFNGILTGTKLLQAFLPKTTKKVLNAFGLPDNILLNTPNQELLNGNKITKLEILFPRVDIEKELSE